MSSEFFLRTKQQASQGFSIRNESAARLRVVHSDKELVEKLGRNDLCPCGSRRRFQEVLHANRAFRRRATQSVRA
ncbi:MAG TPA: SEC-C metal-binding domain-containing protein [Candidatus Dormibacteraeota bacterium]|nr:SEC-C metal-binding domain-containing protein [Candidatus Dormibacteraeota bacterium]